MKIWSLIVILLLSHVNSNSCKFKVCVCNVNNVKEDCKSCSPIKALTGACKTETCKMSIISNEKNLNQLICTVPDYSFNPQSMQLCTMLNNVRGCFALNNKKQLVNVSCLNDPFEFTLKCKIKDNGVTCTKSSEVEEFFEVKDKGKETFSLKEYVPIGEFFWTDELQKNFLDHQVNKDKETSIQEMTRIVEYADYAYELTLVNNPKMLGLKMLRDEKHNLLAVTGFSQILKKNLVVFRGTVSSDKKGDFDLSNIKIDLDSDQKDSDVCPNCKLHNGFYSAFNALKDDLFINIAILQQKYPYSIIFTGHSLGGALAAIAAAHYKDKNSIINASLFTFGSPRVGNREFAEFLNNAITGKNYRVTYGNDPVVCVPNNTDYTHVGINVKFEDKDHFKVGNEADNEGCIPNPFQLTDHSKYWGIYKDKERSKLNRFRLNLKKKRWHASST